MIGKTSRTVLHMISRQCLRTRDSVQALCRMSVLDDNGDLVSHRDRSWSAFTALRRPTRASA